MGVNRFDIWLINLDPTVGTKIRKVRPCVVISPDEMNRHIATVLIAPMTTKSHPYPSRVQCRFDDKEGWIVLDQIRAVDKVRLVRKLGQLAESYQEAVLSVLGKLFAA